MNENKNQRAKKIVGLRHEGKPCSILFMAHELGYACPLCGGSSECDDITFSEYNGFMYCYKCDIDIPSCLCVQYYTPKLSKKKMNKKEIIKRATQIYLDTVLSAIQHSQKQGGTNAKNNIK